MELPRLEPLYKKFKAKGIGVITIDSRGDEERSKKFIADHGLTFPCLYFPPEKNDALRAFYHVQAVPTLYLLDGRGRIILYRLGFTPGDEEKLEKRIATLLER